MTRYFKYQFECGAVYEGDWVEAKVKSEMISDRLNRCTDMGIIGSQPEIDMKASGKKVHYNRRIPEESGLMNGFGVMYYKTGETYEGQWKDGLESIYFFAEFSQKIYVDGKGMLVRLNLDGQTIYEGEFKAGKKEGKGVLSWPNGDKYTGL